MNINNPAVIAHIVSYFKSHSLPDGRVDLHRAATDLSVSLNAFGIARKPHNLFNSIKNQLQIGNYKGWRYDSAIGPDGYSHAVKQSTLKRQSFQPINTKVVDAIEATKFPQGPKKTTATDNSVITAIVANPHLSQKEQAAFAETSSVKHLEQ